MKSDHQNRQSHTSRASAQSVAQSKSASSTFEDKRPEALQAQQLSTDIAQAQKKANNTGLPDQLKSGIENLSGHSMDDVKVHYNSGKPSQLNAHAYAQGTDIHLASGQEKHLPHEAWHVVQQKQGRVKPTISVNGAAVNDDVSLESEADVMGSKAMQMKEMENAAISQVGINEKTPSQLKRLKRDIKGLGSGFAGQWLGSFKDPSFHVTVYSDDSSHIVSRGAKFVSSDFVSEFHITQYRGETVVGRRFYDIDTGNKIGMDQGTITSKFGKLAMEFMAHISSAKSYTDEEAHKYLTEKSKAEQKAAQDKVKRRNQVISQQLSAIGLRAPLDNSTDSFKHLGSVNAALNMENLPVASLEELNESIIQEWPTPVEALHRGLFGKKR